MTTQMDDMGWVPAPDSFGARLALVKQKMRWNAKEAALACGVPQGSWREWELRDRLPRNFEDTARKIAERTGCDMYWLMTGQPTPRGTDPNGGDQSLLPGLNRRPFAYKVSRLTSVPLRSPAPIRIAPEPYRRAA